MGIQGLQSYMQDHPSLFYKINLLNLIKDTPDERRTVILDGMCCLSPLYGEEYINIISNGQYQEFRRNLKEFIDYFQQLNIRLVVFFDGTVTKTKRPVWVKRRYEEQKQLIAICDTLDIGGEISKNHLRHLPPSLLSVAVNEFIKNNCELIYSTDKECDTEILEYANKHNSLAIISNDSDFAVSAGNWLYWSMKDLNIKTNSVFVYDKKGLARFLRLDVEQLPLFATLLGNDYVDRDLLRFWHHRIYKSNSYKAFLNKKKLFQDVASYVSKTKLNLSNTDYGSIAVDVFKKREHADLIKKSCDSYSGIEDKEFKSQSRGDEKWIKILTRAAELKKEHKVSLHLYAFMRYRIFNYSSCFEDYRKPDLPAAGLFWRKLRAKIYGICFSDYKTGPISIEEWISAGPGSLEEPVYVKPIKHNFENFDLLEIWEGKLSVENYKMCWELFCTSMCDKLTVAPVRDLPEYIVPTLLILLYMWCPCGLGKQDFESFLMVNIICNHNSMAVDLIDKNSIKINTKGLRLASVFLRGFKTLEMLSSVCGWIINADYFNLANVYDGCLFQYFYSGKDIEEYRNHPDLVRCMNFIREHKDLFVKVNLSI